VTAAVRILQRATASLRPRCEVARFNAVRRRAEKHRAHATHCLALAEHPLDAESKPVVEETADIWIRLAQEGERFDLS